ncbi:MAG: glycosyltransferase family 4 protein [Gemmatimonadota bacterium]
MAALLIATTQAPFPPRNGVTLAPAALARALRARGHPVWVIHFDAERGGGGDECVGSGDAATAREATRAAVDEFLPVAVRPTPAPALWWAELSGRRPAFDRWRLPEADPMLDRLRELPAPGLIWATPRNAVGSALALRERMAWHGTPLVAAVNDIWTGVLDRRRAAAPTLSRRGGAALRRPFMARAEGHLLSRADAVAVQSPADARVATQELDLPRARVHVLSNGVDEELFRLALERPAHAVGWVGDATGGHYREGLRYLLGEVWPRVVEARPGSRLLLAGPGTSRAAEELGGGVPGVEARGFVPSLPRVYEPLAVLAAPVFKGHGRINKVAEAMAAGVSVVGDATAFNGMDGFRPGVHGVVAERPEEMASAILSLLNDPGRAARVAGAARALARTSFTWDGPVAMVERWLQEGV